MTFEELGIQVILDPKGEKRDSNEYEQSPRPLGDPGSRARTPMPILRGNLALIFRRCFIHVCGHPRPPRQLFRRGHCRRLTYERASSGNRLVWTFSLKCLESTDSSVFLCPGTARLFRLASSTDFLFPTSNPGTYGRGSNASSEQVIARIEPDIWRPCAQNKSTYA